MLGQRLPPLVISCLLASAASGAEAAEAAFGTYGLGGTAFNAGVTPRRGPRFGLRSASITVKSAVPCRSTESSPTRGRRLISSRALCLRFTFPSERSWAAI
jgi:hypothetical protein